MFRKIIKFLVLSPNEKKYLLEALVSLYLAWFMNLILPFKSCLQMVKRRNLKGKEADPETLKQIALGLHRANYLRVWKNKCLVSSFAGRWMLNRRGISSVLSIGVVKDENQKLIAHAWLSAGADDIIRKGNSFNEIYKLK